MEENFSNRGERLDKAIKLLQKYWTEGSVGFKSEYYPTEALAMEPKFSQGGSLPIWVSGNTPPAFLRVGKYGDGWLASQVSNADFAKRAMNSIREAGVSAERDPYSGRV